MCAVHVLNDIKINVKKILVGGGGGGTFVAAS
jgi:spermidine synthase